MARNTTCTRAITLRVTFCHRAASFPLKLIMGISSHQNVISNDTKTTTLTTKNCTVHALSGMGFVHRSPTASYKEVTSMTSGLWAMQLTPYATHKTFKCKKTRGSPHRLTFGINKLILEIAIPSKSHGGGQSCIPAETLAPCHRSHRQLQSDFHGENCTRSGFLHLL